MCSSDLEALSPQATQTDGVAEVGLGWLLQPALDAAGHQGSGPGWSTSLITTAASGQSSVLFTNRLIGVEAVNARILRALA